MSDTRVVVLLTDTAALESASADDATSSSPQTLPRQFQYGGEVNILDDKTLRLLCCQNASKPHVLVAQKLRLDFLANDSSGHVAQIEQELAGLMNCLFVDQRDSLLLHLTPKRGYHLMFLMDALVNQVNAKLQQQGLLLERGCVCYRRLMDDQPMSGCGSRLDTKFHFSHTDDLLSWLLNEYRMRTALAAGHESLHVEYAVAHKARKARFSVNLDIMFVAMAELSLGALCGLRSYFSDDVFTAALALTPLAAHLRQVAENASGKPPKMLLLCNVLATGTQVDAANVQLLGLAHLACQQSKSGAATSLQAAPNMDRPSPAELNQLEAYQQEINNRFQIVQGCLVQYVQHAQQLKMCRQLFDENLASFEALLKQLAGTKFGHMLRKSQPAMQQLDNLFNTLQP